jgi:hypothetical protein
MRKHAEAYIGAEDHSGAIDVLDCFIGDGPFDRIFGEADDNNP